MNGGKMVKGRDLLHQTTYLEKKGNQILLYSRGSEYSMIKTSKCGDM